MMSRVDNIVLNNYIHHFTYFISKAANSFRAILNTSLHGSRHIIQIQFNQKQEGLEYRKVPILLESASCCMTRYVTQREYLSLHLLNKHFAKVELSFLNTR